MYIGRQNAQSMNKTIKTTALVLSISFSVFCFCYLDSVNVITPNVVTVQVLTTEQLNTTEAEKSEIFFPDLQFVERTSKLATRILKVF